MKKVMFLLATLLIGGMMLTGCKPEPTPEPEPEPEPTPTTKTVFYKIANKSAAGYVVSPCFKVNVTYTDANGQSVTENEATLPWTKSIEVTLPFHAKMDGTYTFDEANLPDSVNFGKLFGIGIGVDVFIPSGSVQMFKKAKFLQYAAEHPEKLSFTVEQDF